MMREIHLVSDNQPDNFRVVRNCLHLLVPLLQLIERLPVRDVVNLMQRAGEGDITFVRKRIDRERSNNSKIVEIHKKKGEEEGEGRIRIPPRSHTHTQR